jgi:hypothetical protein
LETEKCVYDVLADIGDRFGIGRVKTVTKYLEVTVRVCLSLLEETRDADHKHTQNPKLISLIFFFVFLANNHFKPTKLSLGRMSSG